jgi:hypothetical protein
VSKVNGADLEITRYLDQFEAVIDLSWEREKLEQWKRFLNFETFERGMRLDECGPGGSEPGPWPKISTNQALESPEMMLLNQLAKPYRIACQHSWMIPNIRCNYGTGIFSSLFEAEIFWMPEELDTLPTTKVLECADPLSHILKTGQPNFDKGWGADVFETAALFKEALADYPKMQEVIWIYHPDMQGPMDTAELLLGESLLLAFYDRPADVMSLMQLMTDTYIAFMKKWFDLVPPRGDGQYMAHWERLYKGGVMIREDSLVNLSPDTYIEFIRPFEQKIFDQFGGGGIHFCGKCDHAVKHMAELKGLSAVNPSQPHLNDGQKIYDATLARQIVLDTPDVITRMVEADFTRGAILT